MMFLIEPTKTLQGNVHIPGSKSGTARGIVLAALAKGESRISNPMPGIDSYSIIDCCRTLGAKIDCSSDSEWVIQGTGMDLKAPGAVLDVGNSGTGYYILTSVASLIQGKTIITGDYQICYRPIAPLLKAIRELGGKAISTRDNELAPLMIEGSIEGGHTVHFPGVNVQWLIGLLIVCPSLKGDTRILVENLGEWPYVLITMDWLNAAGIRVINNNFKEFIIPGGQSYKPFTKTVPSDWCGATYPMVAAAITDSEIKLEKMDINDHQGEKIFVDIIRNMGGKVEVLNNGKDGVIIQGGHPLHGIEIDCKNMPDAIPALAVLGCKAEGKTVLRNIQACRLKETDRAKSIVEELKKMGGRFEETEDSLTIYHADLKGTALSGHHDHRIVMACTCAALAAEGATLIDGAEYVGVSFPRFFEEMTAIGAHIKKLTEQ
ncbi:MAG: 3-phosphoshikimate 1-carboxyvinyltransferase [Clostridiaceae bacterium]